MISLDDAVHVDEQLLERMCRRIQHRGPDDQGLYVDGPVGLGMRRLSIIDLQTGQQPIPNEDRTVWVVQNGEIYNYAELRRRLEQQGHHFRTHSDTEVIVHLYEEYGQDCAAHLRGMFAIAVWDANTQALTLFRDRTGQKPLFYSQPGQTLVFASEMKALLAYPKVCRELSPLALDDYLTYGYIPTPHSIFQGISKLPPAHRLHWHNGNVDIQPYWQVEYRPDSPERSEDEYIEEATALLREAVQLRMISDVPLGAFLSGGLDSSAIVGLMSQVSTQPVKTFAIGFGEETYNELDYARVIARHFQTDHHEFQVTPNAREILEKLVWHFDEPFADSSSIPTYYVSHCARQYVTVALSGDGGDELFAGYRRYLGRKLAEQFNRLPKFVRHHVFQSWISRLPEGTGYTGKSFVKKLKRFMEQAADVEQFPSSSRLPVIHDSLKRQLYSREFQAEVGDREPFAALQPYFDRCAADDGITQMLWVDLLTYLPDDILVKVDRMSMAVSLEARAPFLDHKLIEFLARVPTHLKLHGSTSKYLLKKAVSRLIPQEIIQRPKQGFVVPLAVWFKTDLREYAHDTLLSSMARQRGYFTHHAVERVLSDHEQGNGDYSQQLWALLMFELWCQTFLT